MANTHTYTREEEVANTITHGIGAIFSAVALIVLVVASTLYGTTWHIVGFSVFGITMLLLYTASTLMHSLPEGRLKDRLEMLDHCTIYLFIAGTYTPILLNVIRGSLGWTLLGIVWGIALAGAAFKSLFTKRFLVTSTLLYLMMGWMIVIVWGPLTRQFAEEGLMLLVTGGILYTIGTVFYVWRGFPYHHAVWHLFVLGGTLAHFFAVLLYMLPWYSV